MTTKSPIETLAACLVDLQKTYNDLLKKQDRTAYEEVGVTLRNYSDSLATMFDPFADDDCEDEEVDDE